MERTVKFIYSIAPWITGWIVGWGTYFSYAMGALSEAQAIAKMACTLTILFAIILALMARSKVKSMLVFVAMALILFTCMILLGYHAKVKVSFEIDLSIFAWFAGGLILGTAISFAAVSLLQSLIPSINILRSD